MLAQNINDIVFDRSLAKKILRWIYLKVGYGDERN